MNERTLTRRRFALAAGGAAVVGLAGCADDENGEDDDPDAGEENGEGDDIDIGDDDEPELIIRLENEDGEPVSEGVEIAVEELDGVTTHRINEEIEDGEVSPEVNEGELLITVESMEDEFEPQEEEITFEGEDEEVEFVLEGATADADREDEENGEEEEDEDE